MRKVFLFVIPMLLITGCGRTAPPVSPSSVTVKTETQESKPPDVVGLNLDQVGDWQKDPEAFARLFFGDDLSLRNEGASVAERPGVVEALAGKTVAWPGVVAECPIFGNSELTVVVVPVGDGLINIMAGSHTDGDQTVKLSDMIQDIPRGTKVQVSFTVPAATEELGIAPTIAANGVPIILMGYLHDLRVNVVEKEAPTQ